MRSSVFAAPKNLALAPYTAGSLQGKQHQFEAFFLPLKLVARILLWWYARVWLIRMSFSRNPFADVCRTIPELDASRFAVLEKTDCVAVRKGEVF